MIITIDGVGKSTECCATKGKKSIDLVERKAKKTGRIRVGVPKGRQSRWPYDLGRRSAAAGLLGSRVRTSLMTWMFFCCVCFVL
jgi:hypothetical protein